MDAKEIIEKMKQEGEQFTISVDEVKQLGKDGFADVIEWCLANNPEYRRRVAEYITDQYAPYYFDTDLPVKISDK